MVWTVAVILFIDHVIFNAGATLKDVKNDSAMSAVTMATFAGVRVGKNNSLLVTRRFRGLIMLLKVLSLSVLFASPLWTGIGFAAVQFTLLAVTAVISLCLTRYALNIELFDRKKIGRRWMLQEAAEKTLVPLLLIETAGWQWSLFLIAAPFAWFLFLNAALYRRAISLNDAF
ncbi:MAG: hypothetical protein KGY38_04435 [Desulfobacterales bacterium]|nr:hypothetical protein [Desulfobacterales bacterium]